MIKNVVFDIGNVLATYDWKGFMTSFGFSEDVFQRVCNVTVLNKAWDEVDRGVLSEEEILALFIRQEPELEKEIRLVFKDTHSIVKRRDFAIPWIQELKEQGLKVFYLSNFSDKIYRDCFDALDFLPYTDGGVFSYRVKLIKPDAAIYEMLLRTYGLCAEECVFLDDTQKNLDGAAALGFKTVLFQSEEQAKDDLQRIIESNI